MDFINGILAPSMWPSGFWEGIIKWFSGVGNVAIGVVLLTLCLKILLLPLDFWQKMVSRKMQTQQAIMAPELEEIKKKYAGNPTLLQQKQAEVYKKHNMSPTNSCLAMLVYMVVTMVVFFTLFSGLGNISRSQINHEYYTLEQTYRRVYKENETDPNVAQIARDATTAKYDEIRQGFLSIKNVWRPDNWSSVFPKASEFVKTTNTNFSAFKYEPANITYLVLTTDGQVFEDINGNKYFEPYQDLNNTVYAVFDVSETATNPTSFVIETADGNLEFDNVVYTNIFEEYENTELGISYLYKVSEKQTYENGNETYVMPYAQDGRIFVTSGSLTEVEINGKTYQVETGKTQSDLIEGLTTEEVTRLYATSSANVAIEKFMADFDVVTAGIIEKYQGDWNGYLVLVALAGIITFLSSFLATAGMRARDKKGNQLKAAKPKPTMGIILSVVMILFTISYTSVFALYIITNSLVSMLLTYLTNLTLNKVEFKKEKQREADLPDYVRR